MTTLQDILGLITKGKVKPPTDKDYFIVASYIDSQEVLKPQPKMQANLVSLGALKKFIQTSVGTTPNLQQVTDIGNTTTNGIIINGNNLLGQSFKVTDPLNSTSELYSDVLTIISSSGTTSGYANGALTLGDVNLDITNLVNLSVINDTTNYGVGLLLNSSASLQDISLIYHPDYFIPQAPGNSPSIFYIPYKLEGTYTLATLDDIPTPAYKVYTALISQSGVLDPTLVILENTLGQTVTAARSAPGRYSLNVTGSILLITKTWWTITNDNNNGYLFYMNKDNSFGNTNTVYIDTTIIGGVYTDGILQSTPIEIRVYN